MSRKTHKRAAWEDRIDELNARIESLLSTIRDLREELSAAHAARQSSEHDAEQARKEAAYATDCRLRDERLYIEAMGPLLTLKEAIEGDCVEELRDL